MTHIPYAYLKQVERRIQDPAHRFCRPSSLAAMLAKRRTNTPQPQLNS